MHSSLLKKLTHFPLIRKSVTTALALLCASTLQGPCQGAELLVKPGEKIAFLGDSITAQGAGSPSGYVQLILSALDLNGTKVGGVFAGVGGHKSNDMLARLDNDVLSKQPNWMTLSCGVNDVWHGLKGVPLDQYKENITAIVDKAQAAGIKVVILTATMIHEDQGNESNQKLVAYNDFLRTLAKEKKCLLADLNADMQQAVKGEPAASPRFGHVVTVDGVHMNPQGDQLMAMGVLKTLGLDSAQIEKARVAWQDIPRAVNVQGKSMISIRQFNQLSAIAAKQNLSVPQLMEAEFAKTLDGVLKAAESNR